MVVTSTLATAARQTRSTPQLTATYTLSLYVSVDGGLTFGPAEFPEGFATDHMVYNFVEAVSLHAMFLDVVADTRGSSMQLFGALFASNSHGTAFELVLANTSNTNYAPDVERVASIDGVIVGNQITNVDDVVDGLPALVRTLISFDEGKRERGKKGTQSEHVREGNAHVRGGASVTGAAGGGRAGAHWATIPAPRTRADGTGWACSTPSCSLHLHMNVAGRMKEYEQRNGARRERGHNAAWGPVAAHQLTLS